MTLRELNDELVEWFGSGYCHLTQSKANICSKYYPLSFWNLTVGQFIFTLFLWFCIISLLALIVDEISPITRSR